MFFLDQGQRLAVVGCGRAPSSRFPVAAAPVWRCPAAHPCCCCPADFTSRFLASPAGPLRAASRSYLQPTRYPAHTPDSPPQTQARARLPTCPQPPVLIAASPGSHALIFWAGGGDGAMRHDHHSLPVLANSRWRPPPVCHPSHGRRCSSQLPHHLSTPLSCSISRTSSLLMAVLWYPAGSCPRYMPRTAGL